MIGIGLWLLILAAYTVLLQIFWMPALWWTWLYLGGGLCGGGGLIYLICRPARQIGIDEQGTFLLESGVYKRLSFVRANAVQLIAKVEQGQTFWARIWPQYRVIYRDNVPANVYRVLRSYAAQHILLHRSEDAKELSKSKR